MFDKDHPRFKEASEFRALIETDAEAKTVFDTAVGLENLKRQWGVHAAGVIMSSEPLIDIIPIMKREQDGQIVTQFDYPACESLGLIKMDFLGLRNLTIIDDALDNIAANRGEKLVLEDLALDDVASYELLARGDTLGRLPARRRPDAEPPAAHEARQLRRHLGSPGAVPPWPDGRELAHELRAAQERSAADRADPPRARGAAGRRARHHLRSHRLPGAGDGRGAEARRLQPGSGRHPAPRDGQEEEVRARQAAGGLLRRHDRERLQPGRPERAVEGARVLRGLRLQQGPHRGLRPHRLLDRIPEGALSRRVHGGPADERRRREGQARGVPQRVPPHGHQGASARRGGVDPVLRRRRRRHPLRARCGAQRGHERGRLGRRGTSGRRIRVVPRLPLQSARPRRQQAHGRIADQGGSLRLARLDPPSPHGDP